MATMLTIARASSIHAHLNIPGPLADLIAGYDFCPAFMSTLQSLPKLEASYVCDDAIRRIRITCGKRHRHPTLDVRAMVGSGTAHVLSIVTITWASAYEIATGTDGGLWGAPYPYDWATVSWQLYGQVADAVAKSKTKPETSH